LTSIRGTYVFEVMGGPRTCFVSGAWRSRRTPPVKSTLTAVRWEYRGGRVGFDWYRKRRLFEETFLFVPLVYGVTFSPWTAIASTKQPGYMDSERDSRGYREDRPKPFGPRPPIDITGPRLPRLVQHVAAARCYNCATTLPPDVDFRGKLAPSATPSCTAASSVPTSSHPCVSSALKPIPVRIAMKDKVNECNSFMPRVTVAAKAPTTCRRRRLSKSALPRAAQFRRRPPRLRQALQEAVGAAGCPLGRPAHHPSNAFLPC